MTLGSLRDILRSTFPTPQFALLWDVDKRETISRGRTVEYYTKTFASYEVVQITADVENGTAILVIYVREVKQ